MMFILNSPSIADTTQTAAALLEAIPMVRFQPHIDSSAKRVGDLLLIQNDRKHWAQVPLQSHPKDGERLNSNHVRIWLTQQVGQVVWIWQGKTHTRVRSSLRTSGEALQQMARDALLKQLGTAAGSPSSCESASGGKIASINPHPPRGHLLPMSGETGTAVYEHIEVRPLSLPKGSPYPLQAFRARMRPDYPVAKRICVWLTAGKERIPVWFRVRAKQRVLIAVHPLAYNTPVHQDAFVWQERNVAGLKGQPARSIPERRLLKSSMPSGSILLAGNLIEAPSIAQGQTVTISCHSGRVTLNMEAIALTNGYPGQIVRVKNPRSQKIFSATTTGLQKAEVMA